MKYILRLGFMAIVVVVLAACGGNSDKDNTDKSGETIDESVIIEEIYTSLEETVVIEKSFDDIQLEINALEQADDSLYNDITALGVEDHEKIVDLSTEAIGLLGERATLLEQEKEVLDKSKVEFEKIKELIDSLIDDEKKERLNKLYDTMMKRYEEYDAVYIAYGESLRLTEALYELFQGETYDEGLAFSLINDINDSYDEVLSSNELFNESTILYNELKKELYDYLNDQDLLQ